MPSMQWSREELVSVCAQQHSLFCQTHQSHDGGGGTPTRRHTRRGQQCHVVASRRIISHFVCGFHDTFRQWVGLGPRASTRWHPRCADRRQILSLLLSHTNKTQDFGLQYLFYGGIYLQQATAFHVAVNFTVSYCG